MTTPSKYQKPKRRGKLGFAPLTRHLSPVQKKIGGKRGFHDQAILKHWPEMVGRDIARIAHPHSVKNRRDGRATLIVDCVSAHATELRFRSDEIAMRINAYLGISAIARVDIRHQHIGFAEAKSQFAHAPKPAAPPRPVPDGIKQDITKTKDDGLRAALTSLSVGFYQRNPRTPK